VHLSIEEYVDQGFRSIRISHGNQTMVWNTPTYTRASRTKGLEATKDPYQDFIFREINTFLKTLPEERQNRIWNAYVTVRELFDANYESIALGSRLRQCIAEIYEAMPYEELYQWAEASPMIHIPLSLKTAYGENDPVDMTYLRSDYFDLAVLAVAARPMVPIWGEYIPLIKDDVANTYKEYSAVKLLDKTYILQCPPYTRLLRYIEASIAHRAKEATLHSALLSGLSTEELPEWLLANTLVRRTSMVPISTRNDGPNLITDVYGYVDGTLQNSGHRRFSGPVSPKRITRDDKVGEKQESLAESYKIKQEVPDGDVQMANYYLTMPGNIYQALDPVADPTKLEICLAGIKTMENQDVHLFQRTLVQWTLHAAIPAGYMNLVRKPGLMNAMAVTQALLWEWGFTDLAALLTAKELQQDDEFISLQDSKLKIPQDIIDQMQVIYNTPYSIKEKQVTPRLANPGVRCVDMVLEIMATSDWVLTAPAELQALATKAQGTRKMYVPSDIRVQLARLLIHLYHQRLDFAKRSRLAAFPLRAPMAKAS
jgi:hypothetical protein